MNYLAHIHLADHTNTSLIGNFLGDFVKGSDLSLLEPEIRQGVLLHRKIDQFTDSHSIIAQLKAEFPTNIRRMAGITLDIYFDHLLIHHWETYSSPSLPSLLNDFYLQLSDSDYTGNTRYQRVKQGLLDYRWLKDYQDVLACHRGLKTIEKRLNHRVTFADAAIDHINNNKENINAGFTRFYPSLMDFSASIVHA